MGLHHQSYPPRVFVTREGFKLDRACLALGRFWMGRSCCHVVVDHKGAYGSSQTCFSCPPFPQGFSGGCTFRQPSTQVGPSSQLVSCISGEVASLPDKLRWSQRVSGTSIHRRCLRQMKKDKHTFTKSTKKNISTLYPQTVNQDRPFLS